MYKINIISKSATTIKNNYNHYVRVQPGLGGIRSVRHSVLCTSRISRPKEIKKLLLPELFLISSPDLLIFFSKRVLRKNPLIRWLKEKIFYLL